MGLLGWLEIIKGVLAFPDKILEVVRLFQDTPEEQHNKLLADINAQAALLKKTGRPG